ncbi:MAG: type IV pilus secretin PilQ [Burkholderiales bacterium]|nr:type IV pilus secretin PilQ [Burkholderiales bacterium]
MKRSIKVAILHRVRFGAGAVNLIAMMVLILAMIGAAAPALAESNSIDSVVSVMQGNQTELRLRLKEPLKTAPVSFTVANPPRLAFDLPDTVNGLGSNTVELTQGDIRSVTIVQAGGRSRVVLNLRGSVTNQLRLDGDSLVVSVTPVQSGSYVAAPSAFALTQQARSSANASAVVAPVPVLARADSAAPVAAASVAAPRADNAGSGSVLRDIDFRRGKDNDGRIVVDMSSSQTGVDIRQQGQLIIVDFLKTRVPENLRRKLDVSDFGTPVRSVRIFPQGENARIVIEPSGLWEQNAYQSENQFVIEVKPVKEDPNKLNPGGRAGYRGEKLSLNFQNVDIRALLQVIADFTNLNIVVRDSVAGSLTLRLKDVPWDQALDIVLQSKNLDMRKNGNVILVAPRDELATQEKLELESKMQISEIEPTRLEVFQLNYQKAESVQKLLSDDKQKVLSKTGSAVTDVRTNKLFVRDTGARLDEVRRIISQLDVPVRQVLIEARIVEADDLFSRNLGVKLGYNDRKSTYYTTASQIDPVTGQPVAINVPVYGAGSAIAGSNAYSTLSGNLQGVADLSSQLGCSASGTCAAGIGRPTPLGNTNFVNLPAAVLNGSNPASFAISLFGSSLTRFLNLEISALEADQRGKVVSSPRVLAADQGKAVIEQGTELPYQSATSSGATAIQFKKATLRLEVVPQITPEGNVIMKVKINRDAVGRITPAGFAIDTRAIETDVLVENGGTVVIGGIYEQVESKQTTKVPFLGDLPYLGALFRNNTRSNNKTELLVFLTPRVVADATAVR